MRKAVSKELNKLIEQDIIEKVVDQPTPWISPIVCVPKKDELTRICVDTREANKAIVRERQIMPTLDDFKAKVNGSKYFSKIDLKQAYHQVELEPDSRFITTFQHMKAFFNTKDCLMVHLAVLNYFKTFCNVTLVTSKCEIYCGRYNHFWKE